MRWAWASLLPLGAADWQLAACPPLPDLGDMDLTLSVMSCVLGNQKHASAHFYIRQWYRHIEELSMKAFRCQLSPSVQGVLDILESMDRALCLVKFKDCFELLDRYEKAVERVCLQMEGSIIDCSVMQELRQVPYEAFQTLEQTLADCQPLVDPFWETLTSRPQGVVWSFGAHHAPKSCEADGPDLASNLLCNGWSGILVEGHRQRRRVLQEHFAHRRDLVILSQLAVPETVGALLEDANWNNPILRDLEVDLLQITFGVNDCEILRGILEGGFRPRAVRAIFWHVVPPPLVYRPRTMRQLGDWYEDAFEDDLKECVNAHGEIPGFKFRLRFVGRLREGQLSAPGPRRRRTQRRSLGCALGA
ncbi:unnamed protein product [Effrenium voratum]|uniref:Uncharacterized protein n=1 Tax=Effrenium voratum TaxID=2562239 RepID=A0AA36HPU2_9DINO|nr:unnamed protein product [Effrenium voratum]